MPLRGAVVEHVLDPRPCPQPAQQGARVALVSLADTYRTGRPSSNMVGPRAWPYLGRSLSSAITAISRQSRSVQDRRGATVAATRGARRS